MTTTPPLDRTLYVRHMALRRMRASWADNRGPTAIIEHGANPGLVSHFAKQALTEIAAAMLARQSRRRSVPALEERCPARRTTGWRMLTGTKVIHITERDTQIANVPEGDRRVRQHLVGRGLLRRGRRARRARLGHARAALAAERVRPLGEGPCNQICIARPGMETWVRSLGAGGRDPRHGHPPRRGVHDLRAPHRVRRRQRASTDRPCTTPTARPTRRSTACSSCACAAGRCRSASGSSTTRSSAAATSSACC